MYESFRDGMYRRLRPRDELERMLADRVVLAAWKLRRVQAAEAFRYDESREKMSDWERVNGKLVKVPPPPGKVMAWHRDTFERLAKHEAALERSMYRAMAELRKVQAERGEDHVEDDGEVDGKNEPISETGTLEAAAEQAVCKNEPILVLSPSPAVPGMDGGRGDLGVEIARHAKSPSS